MKEKLRSKGFWVSLVGALLIFIQALGVKVDVPAVNEIVSALLALLVMLGIISNPSPKNGKETDTDGAAEQNGTESDGLSEEKTEESESEGSEKDGGDKA